MNHISPDKPVSRAITATVERLEPRCLLSAAVLAQVPAQSLAVGQAATSLDLASYLDDSAVPAGDTVVNIQTNLASPDNSIPLELTNSATPQTVANFLKYISTGEYANTIIHRSVSSFVIQGGGYTTAGTHISTFGEIPGESATASLTNTTGTIAMALSDGPDSGTSEWFFNLADNSQLDGTEDGGPFTAFGQVMYGGMATIDAIAALPIVDDTSNDAWNTLPVQTGTSGATVTSEANSNFVTVNPVVVPGGVTYTADSSNSNVVATTVSGGSLSVTPLAAGTAEVTVTATDLNGSTATSTFAVSIAGSAAPAPALTPVVAKSSLPVSAVGGVKFNGAVTAVVTNTGNAVSSGIDTVDVYASTGSGVNSGSTLIGTLKKKLNLQPTESARVSIPVRNRSLTAGTYTIFTQTIDSSGNVETSAAGPGIDVAAPAISLSATVEAPSPTSVAPGKSVDFTFAVNNTGNVDSIGAASIAIGLSVDGKTPLVTLTTVKKSLNLKAGAKPIPLRLRVEIPKSQSADTFYPIVTFVQKSASVTAAAAVPLTVS